MLAHSSELLAGVTGSSPHTGEQKKRFPGGHRGSLFIKHVMSPIKVDTCALLIVAHIHLEALGDIIADRSIT